MIDQLIQDLIDLKVDPIVISLVQSEFEDISQSNITPFQGTLVSCSRCGNVSAPKYEIRRMGTKYILLCRTEDGGCSSREILPQCQFIFEGVQCDQPASHYITPSYSPYMDPSPDNIENKHTCIRHIGALLQRPS